MYSCSSTLSQIIEKFLWKCGFSNLGLFCETNIRFLAAILKRDILDRSFLLIYDCFGCVHIWWKFRTEILREITQKWMGPSGMKSSLGTYVLWGKTLHLLSFLRLQTRLQNSCSLSTDKIRYFECLHNEICNASPVWCYIPKHWSHQIVEIWPSNFVT